VQSLLSAARLQYSFARHVGVARTWRMNVEMRRARAACRRAVEAGRYRRMSELDVRALKRSNTAFVFGSGYSLNDIAADEWRHMATGTTIGFNAFVRQRWIDVAFHVVRGWAVDARVEALGAAAEDFASLVRDNPRYRDTVFVYQDDYTALFPHRLLGDGGLPPNTKVFPYRTNRTTDLPTSDFSDGLVHAISTLCDAVNFAVCLGVRTIVLVGVDLYDSRYFWVDPGKTVATDLESGKTIVQETSYRGQHASDRHNTATSGIVPLMARWREHLERQDVRLLVYNSRSLLASVMPVYAPVPGADAA
jgi:hypothetical protein